MLISLALFELGESSLSSTDNIGHEFAVGIFGEYLAFGALSVLGISSWVVVFFCFWAGFMAMFKKSHLVKWPQIISAFTYVFAFSILGALIQDRFFRNMGTTIQNDWSYKEGLGGYIGNIVYGSILKEGVGPLGTSIIVGAILIVSFAFLFGSDITKLSADSLKRFGEYRVKQKETKAQKREVLKKKRAEEEEARLLAEGDEATIKAKKAKEKAPKGKFTLREREKEKNALEPIILEDIESEPVIPTAMVDAPPPIKPKRAAAKGKISLKGTKAAFEENASSAGPLKIVMGSKTKKAKTKQPSRKGNYIFPTMSLLADPPAKDIALDKSEHEATAAALVQTLANFNVKITMGEVFTGPVITRYEVLPAPGVKVGKILGLENDIALGLKAMAVRIQAPVPGKGTVGIEVPNKTPDSVFLRDIIESEDWVNSKAEIPVALGKEVSGRPLVADLTKMPHLLIAGATGAGKTVCINTIIASLLYHSSPEDIRFVMVDPKIVEMQVYNDLPHMMIPVVTDPKKVPGALKWLLKEMEKRYQIFAKLGVRNISGFNDYQKKQKKEEAEASAQSALDEMNQEEDILKDMHDQPDAEAPEIEVPRDADEINIPEKIPYIVCIIDELADLMMVAQAEIETGIARLAQLARAAGIHLIIATQRPSVNVITGIIKANLPSRIAFQVSSKVDSRTILDSGGAEQLIGRGDMLFNPPGSGTLVRSQGCFVSDDEINGIVDFLKQNGPPSYIEEFQMTVDTADDEGGGGPGGGDDDEDELLPQAYEVLRTTKRASTSMLQRRLKIGYNRAARIMELLEDRGIVGPENGSRPREFLVDPETL